MALRNISDQAWHRIRGSVRWSENQRGISYGDSGSRFINTALIIAKSASATITARSTDTPGSGLVDFYHITGSTDLTLTAISGSSDQTVYNIASSEVAANTFLLVQQDEDGYYWVVVEDCG